MHFIRGDGCFDGGVIRILEEEGFMMYLYFEVVVVTRVSLVVGPDV